MQRVKTKKLLQRVIMPSIWVLFWTLALSVGCVKKNQSEDPNPGKTPQQKLEAIYPHPENWKQGVSHGSYYLKNTTSCTACHGGDLSGGTSKVSCTSCHTGFPHSPEFKTTALHGQQFYGDRQSCTACHGKDYSGGDIGVSCTKCHNYPHSPTWADPKAHGAAFITISQTLGQPSDPLKKDLKACMMCHDKVKHPTSPAVACSGCHADMPHSFNFPDDQEGVELPITHSNYYRSHPEKLGSCYSCHSNNQRQAPALETCNLCHSKTNPLPSLNPKTDPKPVTHPGKKLYHTEDNWRTPEGHGVAFYNIGHKEGQPNDVLKRNYSECMSCHDQSKIAQTGATSCFACHVSMPHGFEFPDEKKGIESPILHSTFYRKHPEKLAACYNCHSNPQRHAPKLETCKLCHNEKNPLPVLPPKPEPTPLPKPDKPRYHTDENWEKPEGHGLVFYNIGHREGQPKDVFQRDYKECMSCHAQDQIPRTGATSCGKCHTDQPHQKTFLDKDGTTLIHHKKYVPAHPEEKASCISCHMSTDPKRKSPKFEESCSDCHEPGFPVED